MEITNTAGGITHGDPFVGGAHDATNIKVDVSTLTTDWVDAYGFVKPGCPLQIDGTLAGTGASQTAYCVVIGARKIPGTTTNVGIGTNTNDFILGAATSALLNRDIIEDNIGRVLSANELAAFAASNSLRLTTT
jgi:hypothetical protein